MFIANLLTTGLVSAQFFKAKAIGCVNFAQVDGDQLAGYNKVGMNPAVGIYHDIDEHKSFGFEIAYAQKGSKRVNDPNAAVQPIFIIKSSYIEFPMVYAYKLPAYPSLEIHGGASVGVNVSGTTDDGIVRDADFNKVEASALLGVSYLFNEELAFRVRHSNSINRIGGNYPNARKWLFNRPGMFNRLYSVGFVYTLGQN